MTARGISSAIGAKRAHEEGQTGTLLSISKAEIDNVVASFAGLILAPDFRGNNLFSTAYDKSCKSGAHRNQSSSYLGGIDGGREGCVGQNM